MSLRRVLLLRVGSVVALGAAGCTRDPTVPIGARLAQSEVEVHYAGRDLERAVA